MQLTPVTMVEIVNKGFNFTTWNEFRSDSGFTQKQLQMKSEILQFELLPYEHASIGMVSVHMHCIHNIEEEALYISMLDPLRNQC